MKNKGFTIVELLGVIVILGLIAAFSVPALTKTLRQTSDKEYEEFKKNITLAAESYLHNETDGKVGLKKFINVSTLVENGYLKKTVNPLTNKIVSDDATVIIYKDDDGVERYDFVDYDVTEKGYVKDGLILYYDGYTAPENNTWKDLSGNGNDGTIYGATWENSNYYFDGVDDYIDTGIYAATAFPPQKTFTMELTYIQNKITSIGSTNQKADEGLLFGALSWEGYGISWKASNDSHYSIIGTSRSHGDLKNLRLGKTIENSNNITITLVRDNENKYIKLYENGRLVSSASVQHLDDTYNRGNAMGNIKINGLGVSNGDPKRVYSNINTYSARIYNRALTDEEIRKNYEVDKYRFDIGE